jgi:preprotein translocase subunit SecY
MLIGILPSINASIMMQLLTKAIPKLEDLQNEGGEAGRRKINQYSRLLTLPLAIFQSVAIVILLRQQTISQNLGIDITQNATFSDWFIMISALVAGSMMLMWLGEQITEQGIGNGISLIMFTGIVARLPKSLYTFWTYSTSRAGQKLSAMGWQSPLSLNGLLVLLVAILAVMVVIYLVVKLNEARRDITLHYAKRVRGSREYGGITTKMPIKLTMSGVIPLIFAYAIITGLQLLGSFFVTSSSGFFASLGSSLTSWFGSNSSSGLQTTNMYIYLGTYFGLVFGLSYFYNKVYFEPKQIAEGLQQQGAFIEGIEPGDDTRRYLEVLANKLTFFGAFSVGLLAIMPSIIERIVKVQNVGLGGTGLLITVSVALETLRQIRSKALMYSYDVDMQYDDFSVTKNKNKKEKNKREKALQTDVK